MKVKDAEGLRRGAAITFAKASGEEWVFVDLTLEGDQAYVCQLSVYQRCPYGDLAQHVKLVPVSSFEVVS